MIELKGVAHFSIPVSDVNGSTSPPDRLTANFSHM